MFNDFRIKFKWQYDYTFWLHLLRENVITFVLSFISIQFAIGVALGVNIAWEWQDGLHNDGFNWCDFVAGFGRVYCGTEYATFTFTSAGVVTIVAAGTAGLTSANVTTIEDNDATLNIFDDGSGIGIENELGSTYNTLIDITYYTP